LGKKRYPCVFELKDHCMAREFIQKPSKTKHMRENGSPILKNLEKNLQGLQFDDEKVAERMGEAAARGYFEIAGRSITSNIASTLQGYCHICPTLIAVLSENAPSICKAEDSLAVRVSNVVQPVGALIAILGKLPSHLVKTYIALRKTRGEVTASMISRITGRKRALESAYLNQLAMMGYVVKVRRGRIVYFKVSGEVGKSELGTQTI